MGEGREVGGWSRREQGGENCDGDVCLCVCRGGENYMQKKGVKLVSHGASLS